MTSEARPPTQGFRLTQGARQQGASAVPREEALDSKRKSWSGNTLKELAPVGGGSGRLGNLGQLGMWAETSRLCVTGGVGAGQPAEYARLWTHLYSPQGEVTESRCRGTLTAQPASRWHRPTGIRKDSFPAPVPHANLGLKGEMSGRRAGEPPPHLGQRTTAAVTVMMMP